MKEYTSENSSILDKCVEYVVHDETNSSNDYSNRSNQTERNDLRISRFQQTRQNSNERQSHNIYLQQVPRISKCNVQLSFEGVYDNDASSDSILPAATFRNSSSQARNNFNSEGYVYTNPCIEFPLACKLLLGIIGLALVTGAVASWSMVLTNQDTIKEHIGCSCLDYININGYGNCGKPYKKNIKMFSCYVLEPSTCEDVRNSSTDAGLRFSFIACENNSK